MSQCYSRWSCTEFMIYTKNLFKQRVKNPNFLTESEIFIRKANVFVFLLGSQKLPFASLPKLKNKCQTKVNLYDSWNNNPCYKTLMEKALVKP